MLNSILVFFILLPIYFGYALVIIPVIICLGTLAYSTYFILSFLAKYIFQKYPHNSQARGNAIEHEKFYVNVSDRRLITSNRMGQHILPFPVVRAHQFKMVSDKKKMTREKPL